MKTVGNKFVTWSESHTTAKNDIDYVIKSYKLTQWKTDFYKIFILSQFTLHYKDLQINNHKGPCNHNPISGY